MIDRWFDVGKFFSGAMGQLYTGGDISSLTLFIKTASY
jgi:hypothetical protein